MNKIDAEIKGFDELLQKTEELGRKGSRIQNDALRKAGDLIAREAKKEVPIDTGELEKSIATSNIKTKKGSKRIEVGPSKEIAWRAKFVEFGTSKMRAQPFLSPAFESNKSKAQAIIRAELRRGLGL